MTIPAEEELSQVAQYWAARDSESAKMNAARLENWKRRAFRDPVDVPAAIDTDPDRWPARRSSITPVINLNEVRAA